MTEKNTKTWKSFRPERNNPCMNNTVKAQGKSCAFFMKTNFAN